MPIRGSFTIFNDGGTPSKKDRTFAKRNDVVLWSVVNLLGRDIIVSNITFRNFNPSDPFVEGPQMRPRNIGFREHGTMIGKIRPNAALTSFTFDIFADINGLNTRLADPEMEVCQDIVFTRKQIQAVQRIVKALKQKGKRRSKKKSTVTKATGRKK